MYVSIASFFMSSYTRFFDIESMSVGDANSNHNDNSQFINNLFLNKHFPIFHMFVDTNDEELLNKYSEKINKHNEMINTNPDPDSGFDLFIPKEFSGEYHAYTRIKVDYNIIGVMQHSPSKKFLPYYIYPRSSISKTPLQLCNNVGIIDCGYRGHLMSYFANHNTGLAKVSNSLVNYNTEPYVVEPYSRLTQVCHCKLTPFYVSLHDNKDFFNETLRSDGGFGSTGL